MKVISGLCLLIVTLTYTGAQSQLPPVPSDGSCEPGQSYKQDCNICRCGTDGKIGVCTYKLCPPKTKRDTSATLPVAPSDGTCTPGQSYKVDCNTCVCAPNGKLGACTTKACLTRTKRNPEPQQCAPGQVRQEECNTCHCTNGLWSCTRRLCPSARGRRSTPLPPLPADGTCQPGNSYQIECNTCRCLENGQLACTEKACVTRPKTKRSAGPQQCNNGDVKKEDCNTCHCANGLWACTKQFCVERKQRAAEVCSIGETKVNDCNNCRCIRLQTGGTDWACTKAACPRTRRDVAVTSDLKNTPCAPNDYFHLDCNTCYCNSAKTGYLCTDHICSPENATESTTKAEVDGMLTNLTLEISSTSSTAVTSSATTSFVATTTTAATTVSALHEAVASNYTTVPSVSLAQEITTLKDNSNSSSSSSTIGPTENLNVTIHDGTVG